MTPRPGDRILVSACLLGVNCRYDGGEKRHDGVIAHLREHALVAVPVCPEQLAGLPTPRPQTEFSEGDGAALLANRGRVTSIHGTDMSRRFIQGARETLKVAQICACTCALLKERSPSCGVRQIYRRGQIVSGMGVTAALLEQNGLRLMSEEDLARE
ncbi:uncharacterized protein YbbK (DUF523 family) [Geothermobacter ehrlichii]|uniref:Uncharacterized protein YbbK (DUF523 family) n=1 Tax=Geothermobacter ehrlichii TaxID=213224 RepID=A0A5D3WNI2_9BACT|nr:DUF523 domain-containing protein [Geothermobacter ehrlichii]TYP00085.1 uncharacterized protein YbbK (DUF523 family) [Geothermobacter ehrlichii]